MYVRLCYTGAVTQLGERWGQFLWQSVTNGPYMCVCACVCVRDLERPVSYALTGNIRPPPPPQGKKGLSTGLLMAQMDVTRLHLCVCCFFLNRDG